MRLQLKDKDSLKNRRLISLSMKLQYPLDVVKSRSNKHYLNL